MNKTRLILIAAIMCGFDCSNALNACVCDDWAFSPPVSEKHLDTENYRIITGKVLRIDFLRDTVRNYDTAGTENWHYEAYYNKVQMLVTRNFSNGESGKDTIVIYTGTHPTLDCGYPFHLNNEYLVVLYAGNNHQFNRTSICLPTKELKSALSDIEFIEENQVSSEN